MVKRIILLPVTSLLFLVGALLLLLASNLYTFSRLTDESPIAEIRFRAIDRQQYEATISYGDFCHPEQYILYGDQWRLDARFLKWRPWANMLGFDSLYRIERLGGRYYDVRQENHRHHLSYNLHSAGLVELSSMLAAYDGVFSPVDTLFGSSVYGSMDEAHIYRIYRGQSGLLVREVGTVGSDHPGTGITIEISRACGSEPGVLQRIMRTLRMG